jgi:hypothetical protein
MQQHVSSMRRQLQRPQRCWQPCGWPCMARAGTQRQRTWRAADERAYQPHGDGQKHSAVTPLSAIKAASHVIPGAAAMGITEVDAGHQTARHASHH